MKKIGVRAMTKPSRLLWMLPIVVCCTTGVARADEKDEAVARFERGVSLYEAQNYEGALVEFNAAYKLSKNYKLLYNIGICQMAQKEYAAAAEAFKQYLSEGSFEISEARKADVKDRLSKLAMMIAQVRISTDAPAGATLTVDDRPAGTVPFTDPITVKIGRRQFSITSHGKTATKSVDIQSGDGNPPVSLLLGDSAPTPSPAANTTPAEKPPPPVDDGPSFPWIPWAITAVVGGAAAVTGVLAVNARNDFEEKQATFGVDKSALESDQDRAKQLGLVTDILLAGTAIGAGLSTWLTIRWASAPKPRDRTGQGEPRKAAATADRLMILPLGLGYSRSF
jgi:hypothetical protein